MSVIRGLGGVNSNIEELARVKIQIKRLDRVNNEVLYQGCIKMESMVSRIPDKLFAVRQIT